MVRSAESVVIARPAGEVFDYVADLRNEPKWHVDVSSVPRETDRVPVVGRTYPVKFKPFMGKTDGSCRCQLRLRQRHHRSRRTPRHRQPRQADSSLPSPPDVVVANEVFEIVVAFPAEQLVVAPLAVHAVGAKAAIKDIIGHRR